MTLRVHLDTDIGGDSDDLCALALLLASEEVDLVGITTVGDREGGRAAFARHALRLAGREGVAVAAGAASFLGGWQHALIDQDERYWPDAPAPGQGRSGEALDLLEKSARSGATIIAIGPYTNLALLETLRPGALAGASVAVMGGYTGPAAAGLPQWGPEWDYNMQADRVAARIVFERLSPLIVPLGITLEVHLREADARELAAGGPLARLIARQGRLQALDDRRDELTRANAGLPGDLLNFQYDPLACAAALEWDCITVSEQRLALREMPDSSLAFVSSGEGPLRRVVSAVDAGRFSAEWLARVRQV